MEPHPSLEQTTNENKDFTLFYHNIILSLFTKSNLMIYIVQVFPYQTNNGCSVRIGKKTRVGKEPLESSQCDVFEFVEYDYEVEEMIQTIENLPNYYNQKKESLEKLHKYLAMIRKRTAEASAVKRYEEGDSIK